MDIKHLFTIIKHWLWLVVLGALLAGAAGYILSNRQTPVYQSSTRFVVLRSAQTTNDYYSYLDSQQLISTYAQLLSTESLLNQASEELGFPVSKGMATAAQIGETQFVELTVTHIDPEKAAAIANGLVKILIQQNEQLQAVRYITAEQNLQNRIDEAQEQIEVLQTQINDISTATVETQLTKVQEQIDSLQTQITDMKAEMATLSPKWGTEQEKARYADLEVTIAQLEPVLELYQQIYTNLVVLGIPAESGTSTTTTQMDQLQTTLDLYQQIYISSISSLEALRLTRAQSTPNVVQVEAAHVPSTPISPKPFQTAFVAGMIGLLITAGISFLIEYLDDTIKTPDEVKAVLDLPVLGLIGDVKFSGNETSGQYVARHPRSPVSEAFRAIRTNLEFSSVANPLKTILITSSGESEGKTTIASNLAIVLAQNDKKVLLLDSDLRRPKVHNQFGLTNWIGLSDVIRGKVGIQDAVKSYDDIKDLSIITSGSLPPNPAELLGSDRMVALLDEMRSQYDVVIIDSPPMLVSDAQILSARADGVIYVIIPGNTRAIAATRPLEELRRINVRLLGVVMNRIPRNRDYYYGGYTYYSPYTNHDDYHHSEPLTGKQEDQSAR